MTSVGDTPQIIAFGYYDGPTNGILRMEKSRCEYWFDCFATISGDDVDLLGIKLYPLPSGTFDSVATRLYANTPLRKVSVVIGDFYKQRKNEVDAIFMAIDRIQGVLEKAVAWQDSDRVIIGETTHDLANDRSLIEWLTGLSNAANEQQ